MDAYAIELKASHDEWKEQIGQAKPGSDPSQVASRSAGTGDRGPAGPFALRIAEGRGGASVPRRGDELHPPTHAARVKASRGQTLLPMFGPPPANRHASQRRRLESRRTAPDFFPMIPSPLRLRPRRGLSSATLQPPPGRASTGLTLRNGVEPGRQAAGLRRCRFGRTGDGPSREPLPAEAADGRSGERPRLAGPQTPGGNHVMEETDTTTAPPVIASGEKAKARDIIAAIRTLQAIEQRAPPGHRRGAADTRPLRRLRGRGPVAVSRSRSPAATRTPAGRPSATSSNPCCRRRNTIQRPHAPSSASISPRPSSCRPCTGRLRRLGVPAERHRARARLRHRQFHGAMPRAGMRFIGVELDSASPAASPAPCIPRPTSASRASATRSCPRASTP